MNTHKTHTQYHTIEQGREIARRGCLGLLMYRPTDIVPDGSFYHVFEGISTNLREMMWGIHDCALNIWMCPYFVWELSSLCRVT